MDPLDLIEARLNERVAKVKRRNDTIEACCPAHDDNSPSLSVAKGTTRDVVITCHAGCSADAVMAALNLKWTDLSESRTSDTAIEYVYRYADGRIAYYVVRLPGKQFRQKHVDPNTGEFVWNIKGITRQLYRLPEVLAAVAANQTVYIVEGEKDADRLHAMGLTATCNSGGALKFTDDMACQLKGADVVIVADRDEVGYEHAAMVRRLVEPHAWSVTVVAAKIGKDVTDHLDLNLAIDDLVPVDPDEWSDQDAPATPAESLFVDWTAFWDRDANDAEWVLEPIIPKGRGVALFAPGGTGKSLLALWAAVRAATGGDGLAGFVEPIHVVYFDYEMNQDDLRERLETMGYGPSDDLSRLHYALLPPIGPADTAEGGETIIALAKAHGAELVVIDTFSRAVAGDENEADTTRDFYRHTGMGLKSAGIAMVRVDHAGKDTERGQRGSSAKNDDVDVVWEMKRTDGGFQLIAKKRRMGWVPETVDLIQDDDPVLRYRTVMESVPHGTADVVAHLNALGLPMDCSSRVAQRALAGAGSGARMVVIRAAVKHRKRSVMTGPTPGPTGNAQFRDPFGTHPVTTPSDQAGPTPGPTRTHQPGDGGTLGPSIDRDPVPPPDPEDDPFDLFGDF